MSNYISACVCVLMVSDETIALRLSEVVFVSNKVMSGQRFTANRSLILKEKLSVVALLSDHAAAVMCQTVGVGH